MALLRLSALCSLVLLVGALAVACGPAASAGTTNAGRAATWGTVLVRYLVPTVT